MSGPTSDPDSEGRAAAASFLERCREGKASPEELAALLESLRSGDLLRGACAELLRSLTHGEAIDAERQSLGRAFAHSFLERAKAGEASPIELATLLDILRADGLLFSACEVFFPLLIAGQAGCKPVPRGLVSPEVEARVIAFLAAHPGCTALVLGAACELPAPAKVLAELAYHMGYGIRTGYCLVPSKRGKAPRLQRTYYLTHRPTPAR